MKDTKPVPIKIESVALLSIVVVKQGQTYVDESGASYANPPKRIIIEGQTFNFDDSEETLGDCVCWHFVRA